MTGRTGAPVRTELPHTLTKHLLVCVAPRAVEQLGQPHPQDSVFHPASQNIPPPPWKCTAHVPHRTRTKESQAMCPCGSTWAVFFMEITPMLWDSRRTVQMCTAPFRERSTRWKQREGTVCTGRATFQTASTFRDHLSRSHFSGMSLTCREGTSTLLQVAHPFTTFSPF